MWSWIALVRPRVSLAVAGGSLFGVLYHGGAAFMPGLGTVLGAGMLCGACSALNQVQERQFDARMQRTRHRPVAAGRLSAPRAALIAVALLAVGLSLFFLAGGWPLLLLGGAVPFVYNGLYTPLKPLTPMALLVGGLSGALPPLTGWVGAGGSMTDPAILGVTAIFYLWQVPHFWLLQEKHRSDYERAGFATLKSRLPQGLHKPMLSLWIAAYFLGLGCLMAMEGIDSLNWFLPVAVMLAGGYALFSVARERRHGAAVAVYSSLPLALLFLLTNTL